MSGLGVVSLPGKHVWSVGDEHQWDDHDVDARVGSVKVIQAVVDRILKPGLAAERLHLTVRQVERLVLRYKQAGAAGVGSAAQGRPGNRKLDEATAYRALILIRDRYAEFGPTLACEKLRECHGLTLSKETVRHLIGLPFM